MEIEKEYCTSINNHSLYNSRICRLCSEENLNGSPLFYEGNEDFVVLINKYLPIKIINDGKYPRWICGACNLQVEATIQFCKLIELGQKHLNEMFQNECRKMNSLPNEPSLISFSDNVEHLNEIQKEDNQTITEISDDTLTNCDMLNIVSDSTSVKIIKEKFKNSSPTNSKQISLLKTNQKQVKCSLLDTNNKKKRGRPSKHNLETCVSSSISIVDDKERENNNIHELIDPNSSEEESILRSTRRQIKTPLRYQSSVHGREYEKIYEDMGIVAKISNNYIYNENSDGNSGDNNDEESGDNSGVIGYVQSNNGESLGDLIVIEKNKNVKYRKSKDMRNCKNSKKKSHFMCDVCQLSFSLENKFLQHRFTHKNVRYECSECLESFLSKNLLIEHQTNENHSGAGIIEEFVNINNDSIISNMCDKNETLVDVSEPVKNSTSPSITKQQKENWKQLNDNITKENCIDSLDCDNQNSKQLNPLENDFENINEKENLCSANKILSQSSYICKICSDSKTFKSRGSLSYHMYIKHNEGRVYICSKCDKKFASRERLKCHQLTHVTVKPYNCQICGKGFKTKLVRDNHQSIHTGDMKFSCEKCGQKFAYKRSLKSHKFVHEGLKPFRCKECGKSFTQYGNMQEHYRIHTNERPFSCHICSKTFRASSQYKSHIKCHQIERPIKCMKCDKSFTSSKELRIHLRNNHVKSFTCTYCDKNFKNFQALKKHCRIHTGERPYPCTVCQKKFSDRSNFKRHQKTHENKFKQNELSELRLYDDDGLDNDVGDDYDELVESDKYLEDKLNENDKERTNLLTKINVIGNEDHGNNSDIDLIIGDKKTYEFNSNKNNENISNFDNNNKTTSDYIKNNFKENQIITITYQDPNNIGAKTTLFVVNKNI